MNNSQSTVIPPLDQQWRPHNPWLIALTVMLATFMEVLDTSIANVALPHIAGNLSATIDESTWVLTSYLVSNAIMLPLSGWFSMLMGRKKFFILCVMIFTVKFVFVRPCAEYRDAGTVSHSSRGRRRRDAAAGTVDSY